MEWSWIVVGLVSLWLLNKLIVGPLWKLMANAIVGYIILWGVNYLGSTYHYWQNTVPLTLITGIIIGIFGVPGALVVSLYYILIH